MIGMKPSNLKPPNLAITLVAVLFAFTLPPTSSASTKNHEQTISESSASTANHEQTISDASTKLTLRVPTTTILGMQPHQWQQILDMLADDEDLYEPTQDIQFNTLAENLYVRLHRYLFKKKKLPVDLFGRTPDMKQANLFQQNWTHAPHLPRESINRFWAKHKDQIPQGSKCLEHFPTFYIKDHTNCKETWTLDYEGESGTARVDAAKSIIYDDLANFSSSHLYNKFDVIVATQVLELPSNPYRVAQTWYKLLKPGGLLFTTQPFVERDVRPSTNWPDHFRFTDIGVESVLQSKQVGFVIDHFYYGGNAELTLGFLNGFSTYDFSERELRATLLKRGVDPAEDIYYSTLIVAHKPKNNNV